VVRTDAPIGQTPILKETCSREHLSVISGITPAGKLYTMVREQAFDSAAVVEFLKHLHRR
jgi:hypothetical protein